MRRIANDADEDELPLDILDMEQLKRKTIMALSPAGMGPPWFVTSRERSWGVSRLVHALSHNEQHPKYRFNTISELFEALLDESWELRVYDNSAELVEDLHALLR